MTPKRLDEIKKRLETMGLAVRMFGMSCKQDEELLRYCFQDLKDLLAEVETLKAQLVKVAAQSADSCQPVRAGTQTDREAER